MVCLQFGPAGLPWQNLPRPARPPHPAVALERCCPRIFPESKGARPIAGGLRWLSNVARNAARNASEVRDLGMRAERRGQGHAGRGAMQDWLSFGDFTIDRGDERLLGPQGPVRLGNKAFRVLL